MKLNLNPRFKILLAVLLFVAAVAAWYTLYLQGTSQEVTAAPPVRTTAAKKPTPEKAKAVTTPSARALEILPLPFLVTEAPKEEPAKVEEKEEKPAPIAAAPEEKPLPNPFKPLPQRLRQAAAKAAPPRAAGTPAAPRPVPKAEEPVTIVAAKAPELAPTVAPKIPPPREKEPLIPPEPGPATGVLPIKLRPLEREVVPVRGEGQAQAKRTEANPLKAFVEELELKLSGVALGPVSVAIFSTKEGYVVLPVGDRFPGSEVVLKEVRADEVVLALGEHILKLTLSKGEEYGKS